MQAAKNTTAPETITVDSPVVACDGGGGALGDGLAADIDHYGVAGAVEMGEAGHAARSSPSSARVAAVTSG